MTDVEKIIYKIKGVSLCEDEYGHNYLKVKLVERFVDGKYDKFIPLKEGKELLQGAVIDPQKRNIVMSKTELKKEKKKKNKEQLDKSSLIDSILFDMES